VAPQAGSVAAVELGTVVVVVVEPLPLAGAPTGGELAEPPPDPQAAARMPTSATPRTRAATLLGRIERVVTC